MTCLNLIVNIALSFIVKTELNLQTMIIQYIVVPIAGILSGISGIKVYKKRKQKKQSDMLMATVGIILCVLFCVISLIYTCVFADFKSALKPQSASNSQSMSVIDESVTSDKTTNEESSANNGDNTVDSENDGLTGTIELAFSPGEIINGKYKNLSLNWQLDPPDGYVFLTNEEFYDRFSYEIPEDFRINYEMILEQVGEQDPYFKNTIRIVVEPAEEHATVDEWLEVMSAGVTSGLQKSGKPFSMNIAGKNFTVQEYTSSSGYSNGEYDMVCLYNELQKDVAIQIRVGWPTYEDKNEIKNIINSFENWSI